MQSLNLFQWSDSLLNNQRLCVKLDKTDPTILKYRHHPSIKMIKKRFLDLPVFNFQAVSVVDVKEIMMELKTDKAVSGEAPVELLKDCDFSFHALTNCISECNIENGTFPDSLKEANIAPVCKSKNPFEKSNYRPVSILPLLSKVYERIIFKQLSNHTKYFLSQILCGFRKTSSTQHAFLRLLQSWQRELDESGYVGTILMDFSKAYDCIPRQILIAKLEAYGLHKNSLNLLSDYLSGRKQRTKIGSVFSELCKIICGIPQGSVLVPLLFNIFINNLFFFVLKCDICNFAHDNTTYSCNKLLSKILANLRFDLNSVLMCFTVNSLNPNPGKFQHIILGKCVTNQLSLFINGIKIERAPEVVLLGITIADQLTFKTHIEYICRMAKYKLRALQRIRNYLSTKKPMLLATAFINSQFYYAPLIWMIAGKTNIKSTKNSL